MKRRDFLKLVAGALASLGLRIEADTPVEADAQPARVVSEYTYWPENSTASASGVYEVKLTAAEMDADKVITIQPAPEFIWVTDGVVFETTHSGPYWGTDADLT